MVASGPTMIPFSTFLISYFSKVLQTYWGKYSGKNSKIPAQIARKESGSKAVLSSVKKVKRVKQEGSGSIPPIENFREFKLWTLKKLFYGISTSKKKRKNCGLYDGNAYNCFHVHDIYIIKLLLY